MANGADGSIIIDTSLDNTGFQRGSKRMNSALNSLMGTMNRIGKSMAGAMKAPSSTLQQFGRTATQTGEQVKTAMSSGLFGKTVGDLQKYINSITGQLTKLSDAERIGVKTDTQMTRFQLGAEKARAALEELRQKLIEMGDNSVSLQSYESLQAEFEKLDAQMAKLYQKQAQMEELGIKTNSLSYRRVAMELEQVGAQYDAVLEKMQAVRENGDTAAPTYSTEAYQQLVEQFNALEAALQRVEQTSAGFGNQMSAKANEAAGHVRQVGQELEQTPAKADAATQGMGSFVSALKTAAGIGLKNFMQFPFKAIQTGAKAAANGIKGLVSRIKEFMTKGRQGGLSANGLVKSLLSIKNMLMSRIKSAFLNSITQGVQQGIQSLARYSSAFNASMSGMKNAMTGLSGNISVFAGNLINALAPAITTIINLVSTAISYLNAFFALIGGKKIMTVAKKGTDNYAKSLGGAAGAAGELKEQVYGFDELNRADDNGGGGGSGGGGGAGGGFEEVAVDSLLPESLRQFMQDIIDAFNAGEFEKVGALVATGLNGVITRIDDWINGTFRPEATKWAANIARIMNGFVAAFNWKNLGKTIADGFNAIVDTINTFMTTFSFDALAQGFSDGINGIVKNIEWDLLGATIANGLQALYTLIWGTLSGIRWVDLGANLASGLQTMFNSFDFAKAGEQVFNSIKGIINGISKFLIETDWQQIGTQVASLFSRINWSGLAVSLSTGINRAVNSAFNLVHSFVTSIDWKSIGSAIGTFINGLEVDKWIAEALAIFIDFCTASIEAWIGILETTNWRALGDKIMTGIGDAIAGIDWGGLAQKAAELLGAAFGALVGLASGLGDKIWEWLKAAWEGVKAYFQPFFDEFGGNIIDGLLVGIVNALVNIVDWIYTNIFTPFINGFKQAFGIASPSKEMETMGGFILEGLINGIKNGINSAIETIKGFFKSILDAIKGLFGIASPSTEMATIGGFILDGLIAGLKSAIDGVIKTVKEIFGRIWDAIKSIFGFGGESEESKDAKQAGKDIMTGIQEGITGNEDQVKTAIKNAAKHALDQFKTELGVNGSTSTKTKPYGEAVVNGAKDGIESKGVSGTFSSAANKVWNAVKDALNAAFGVREGGAASKTKYVGEGSVLGVNSGIQDKAKKNTFSSAATDTINAVKDALNASFGLSGSGNGGKATQTKYAGEGVASGIVEGIQTKAVESTFSKAATAVYKAVSSAMNTALGISGSVASKFKDVGKAICQGVADGITSNTSIIKSAAEKAAQSALNAAKNKLGIHSPSRVFAELGGFMMQGMANGLNDGQPIVNKTIANIADSLTDGINGASFDVSGDAMMNGLDRVADKLDNIARIFAAITGVISDLGGRLNMPSIATGEYAPPHTRVDGSALHSSEQIVDALHKIEIARDELMYMVRDEIRDKAEEVIKAIINSKATIDGQSLERTLASIRRDRDRSFGGAY